MNELTNLEVTLNALKAYNEKYPVKGLNLDGLEIQDVGRLMNVFTWVIYIVGPMALDVLQVCLLDYQKSIGQEIRLQVKQGNFESLKDIEFN